MRASLALSFAALTSAPGVHVLGGPGDAFGDPNAPPALDLKGRPWGMPTVDVSITGTGKAASKDGYDTYRVTAHFGAKATDVRDRPRPCPPPPARVPIAPSFAGPRSRAHASVSNRQPSFSPIAAAGLRALRRGRGPDDRAARVPGRRPVRQQHRPG